VRGIEASRHANVAIYFLNTRGLQGLGSTYGAEFDFPIAEQDMGAAMADLSQEAAGSEYLANDTGGFVIREGDNDTIKITVGSDTATATIHASDDAAATGFPYSYSGANMATEACLGFNAFNSR